MTKNEGKMDQMIRLILGVVLLGLAFFGGLSGALYWIALVVGVVMLVTSVTGFCPLYRVFGINTCNRK